MRLGLSTALAIVVALTLGTVRPTGVMADNAPMWESPVGLTPGAPDNQVRMVRETVDLQIVERGEELHALVRADFEMVNRGPDTTMKVGFPNWVYSVLTAAAARPGGSDDTPYSPVAFTTANVSAFRARTDQTEYRPVEQDVKLGPDDRYGSRWFVWEMTYPGGQALTVHVAYDQRLDWGNAPAYVQPMYVLRTGALWDDTIGEATIILTAPSGGIFVGGPELFGGPADDGSVRTVPADQATEATETRLVWHLQNFEPDRDVGTTYLTASAQATLRDAEAAVGAPGAPGSAYVAATRAALRLIGHDGPYGVPFTLVETLPARARQWAAQAVELLPNSAEAWEVGGDVELWYAMPTHKHHGELDCWPEAAAQAYDRAIALGSPTAAARKDDLQAARDFHHQIDPTSPLQPCAPPGALDVTPPELSRS